MVFPESLLTRRRWQVLSSPLVINSSCHVKKVSTFSIDISLSSRMRLFPAYLLYLGVLHDETLFHLGELKRIHSLNTLMRFILCIQRG